MLNSSKFFFTNHESQGGRTQCLLILGQDEMSTALRKISDL